MKTGVGVVVSYFNVVIIFFYYSGQPFDIDSLSFAAMSERFIATVESVLGLSVNYLNININAEL